MENEVITEFNSIWPPVNKTWLQFKSTGPKSSLIKRFWINIISNHVVVYPNLCELLTLFLCVSPDTGLVERSFLKLTKICYKDRRNVKSSTLEALYLLSSMNIHGDDLLLKKIRNILSTDWILFISQYEGDEDIFSLFQQYLSFLSYILP